METKQCSRCREVKPLSRFYKKSANEDGLESQCKQCHSESRTEKRKAENEYLERCFAKDPKHAYLSRPEYVEEAKKQAEQQREKRRERARQYYAKNREKIREYARQYYAKNRERKKEQIRKYQNEHREEIKEQRSQYNIEHREEAKKRSRQYYIEHHEERLEYTRWYRAKHQEEIAEYHRQWRAKNRERVSEYKHQYYVEHRKETRERGAQRRAENPDYHRQYRIDNASKYRTYTANRKALSIAAEGTFTDEQFAELCNKYGNRCLCCGKDNVKLTVDHIVPLSKGGSNDMKNIQCLCRQCNSKKATKTIDYRPDKDDKPSHTVT